ncbi:MAG TPA: hypothetical protein VGH28_27465 [Polyangiaceae bacterium]|jgi:hypothetical protein
MTRNRILALSSIVLIASGGLIFACGGDDSGTDGGSDAKADQTSNKDGGSDAAKDGSPFPDAGKDATVQDSGNDATLQDATTDAIETDAPPDSSDDGAVTDASLDGGALTFMVVRVNGGADPDAGADASPNGEADTVFLEERSVVDGSLVRTISLPVAVNGSNQPFTLNGNSTSEGSLSLSADGHYVVLAGYGAAPGTASITSTATDGGVLRVVARVDKNGTVDTTTELAAYSGKNPRGATSNDGTSFWVTGAGSTNEGPQYVALSSTGASTTLATAPTNVRFVQIFAGQVYISTGASTFHGVSAVGTGMPTTSGQTVTLLPGMPGTTGSQYGFYMLDQDGGFNGLDTLYMCDDSTGDGVEKWTYNGTTWAKVTTFTDGTTNGCRGVLAYPDGNNIVVIATTGGTSPGNKILKYIDDGQNLTPTSTLLATATTNTVYRGVALSPQ